MTFSASSPVTISFLHRISVDNNTLSDLIQNYGKSSPDLIRDIPSQHHFGGKATQIISSISPDYGISTPYFSASIPFVANGVAFWSPQGTLFIAAYQVSATLAQPRIFNNINNDTLNAVQ